MAANTSQQLFELDKFLWIVILGDQCFRVRRIVGTGTLSRLG